MTILVFGANGQVGQCLARMQGVHAVDRGGADLATPGACAKLIMAEPWDGVINAAAYTAVDRAETETETAFRVNETAPGEMAKAAAHRDIPFVHISTDYVFDGAGREPFTPDHGAAPLNIYGASKWAGEQAVRAAGGRFAILRTSWVFSAGGANFVTTMLRLGATQDSLNIVDDQVGGPTPADAIAQACLRICQMLSEAPEKSGTYHFSGFPDVSWCGFARQIFDKAGLKTVVKPIPTASYPTPAKRPMNSRMACQTTQDAFGLARPDWRIALDRVIKEKAS